MSANYHHRKLAFLSFLLISLLTILSAQAETAPPNDNLTNAIVLSGTDVTFSGALAGSTLEDSADSGGDTYTTATGSVWWAWNAPTSTVLNFEIAQFQSPISNKFAMLTVYSATNGVVKPAGLNQPALGSVVLWPGIAYQTLSIPVSGGGLYLIQLVGNTSNSYAFRLLATNAPLIVKQPLSQTVYSNACTILYVVPGGLQPRTYQWSFNGTNIPGETAPILGLTNIKGNMSGSYAVLVSNSSGSVVSAPATLAISQSYVPPVFTLFSEHSNVFTSSLAGELGRAYEIQSSTNLSNWTNENSYPMPPQIRTTQVLSNFVYTTNNPVIMSVTNHSSRKFYRAYIYKAPDADSEICINNLRQIAVAKILWQLDTQNDPVTAWPASRGLTSYFAHPSSIYCPFDENHSIDTSYWIGQLTNFPACEISPAHAFHGVP